MLAKYRQRAGLKHEALAAKLGVSLGTFTNWERGRTKPGKPLEANQVVFDLTVFQLCFLPRTSLLPCGEGIVFAQASVRRGEIKTQPLTIREIW